MSLYKRGNVYWAYFFIDGVRQQHSTGTSNRRQAEAIETKLKAEANARRHQLIEADSKMKFDELAARFVAGGSARPHHLYHLKILLPYFGHMQVMRLTKPMTEEFRKARKAARPDIPLKDATVNRDLSVLRHILYWAVDERLLVSNPLSRLKLARERRVKRQVLSLEEEMRLLAAASEHLRAMVIAALDTGMRRGEITGQRWEDIDLARRLLFVSRSKTPEGEAREIPLTTRLYELLAQRRQPEGVVFGYQGEQVKIIKTTWRSALRNAGVRHLRFHDLRHTYATRLMEAGVLQEVRMALMGHSSGAKIHSVYTHIELPTKREAVRRLEAWVNQQLEELAKEQYDANRKAELGTEGARDEINASGEGRRPQALEEEEPGRHSD